MSNIATNCDASDAACKVLHALSNPFSQQVQATSVVVALGTSLGTMVFIAILFSIVRPHHSAIYAPKTKHADKQHAPPPIGGGFFAWFTPVIKTKELELVDRIGMDGAIFLRFTRMLRNMFLFLSVLGCAILIPVHLKYSDVSKEAVKSKRDENGIGAAASSQIFQNLTPQAVTGAPLWSHVVFAYVSDAIVLYFLWTNYRHVVRLRRLYFESPEYQHSLHSRTLIVTDIAQQSRSDEGVLKIIDSAGQRNSSIPRTAIARNLKQLPELIEEHEEAVKKLEVVLAKYLKNPDKLPPKRPTIHRLGKASGKVDAIDHLTTCIQELEVRIEDVRGSIDRRNPMPYGFATYDRIQDAHAVAYASRKKSVQGAHVRLSHSPRDIIWKNLPLSKKARGGKRFTANLWVALLTLLWIAPNALIAVFLVNLSNLASVWDAFNTTYKAHLTAWGAVQAIAGPTLLSIFYVFLPSIFRRISTQAGDSTKTSRERHVTHKLYAFFVFNNLIIFSIFSTAWTFIAGIIAAAESGQGSSAVLSALENGQVVNTLLRSLCQISPFWITWLLQRNLGAAIDLAQIVNLLYQWFNRTFMAPTPRELIELTAPPPFDYADYYNYFLYYATVALFYSTIQPVVLPIVCLYFVIDCWLKKYLLLYVFITKTESGGQFWNVLHNRILFATFLQNLVGAFVIIAAQGTWIMIAVMAPLPLVIFAFKWYCTKNFADQARYYTKAVMPKDVEAPLPDPSMAKQFGGPQKGISSRLTNPMLTKPLMTPMVHAKSQHLLASIYRGRLDNASSIEDTSYSGATAAAGYGDIPMRAIPPVGGRAQPNSALDMFELVPESALDFEHFKDRPEFREQFGGGGELYGNNSTDISRSGTPATFVGSDGMSTRVGTPEPAPPKGSMAGAPASGMHPAFRLPPPQGLGGSGAAGWEFAGAGRGRGSEAGVQRRPMLYGRPSGSGTGSSRNLLGSAQPMGYAPVPLHGRAGSGGGGGNEAGTPGEEVGELEALRRGGWGSGRGQRGYANVPGGEEGADAGAYRSYRR